MLEQLRADRSIAESTRAVALEIATRVTSPLVSRNLASWQIVRDRKLARERYDLALRHAEEICRLQPEDGTYKKDEKKKGTS